MIFSRTAFSQIHGVKTSVTRSLDIKENYEEIVNSLLVYLKQIGKGANILLAEDNTNKLTVPLCGTVLYHILYAK
jgi:hypothetical protein